MTQIRYGVIAIPCAEATTGQVECIGEVPGEWISPKTVMTRSEYKIKQGRIETLKKRAFLLALNDGYWPIMEAQGGKSEILDARASSAYPCNTGGLPTVSITVDPEQMDEQF